MERIIFDILSVINIIGTSMAIVLLLFVLFKCKTLKIVWAMGILCLDVCIALIIWNMFIPKEFTMKIWYFKSIATVMWIIKIQMFIIIKNYHLVKNK